MHWQPIKHKLQTEGQLPILTFNHPAIFDYVKAKSLVASAERTLKLTFANMITMHYQQSRVKISWTGHLPGAYAALNHFRIDPVFDLISSWRLKFISHEIDSTVKGISQIGLIRVLCIRRLNNLTEEKTNESLQNAVFVRTMMRNWRFKQTTKSPTNFLAGNLKALEYAACGTIGVTGYPCKRSFAVNKE
ncbi:hypothetical protein HYPSUDRAFT_51169 [Hypholoma sublateritium FD-334 SS-4]|uniref:Uncharacterized protein n=1 Tax=Hypholoma sublateritium (strain FD-334 SS-4) TaxID=945553 RepID=A0A0D2LKN9_HYPSF|nr:hypothetical protein HYPSUDRAFT_51169 [Hypholoma sublateritium FD-334 SS-4]